MEIIHLILGKANPARMNGVNRVVHEMATHQSAAGYPVQVWGITASPIHDYPSRCYRTRLFRTCINPFGLDRTLQEALWDRRGKIVVHIHGAFIPAFYSAGKFLHKHNIPFIITPHSTYNRVMMRKNAVRKSVYFRLFERRMLDRASAIHLLGRSEWEGLAHIYHNRRSVILPYGFTKPDDNKEDNKAAIFSIAYCGRMAIRLKGLDLLLAGFSIFHRKHPDSRLVMIGDGKELPRIRKLAAQLGLQDAVEFTGSLFGKEKEAALRQSHVFAHPSRTDGLPATIIEAASLGLPCLVSAATNMGEYIERHQAGYLMKETNAAALAEGLFLLYDRIGRKEEGPVLSANARRMVREEFNWDLLLRRFDEIYRASLNVSTRTF